MINPEIIGDVGAKRRSRHQAGVSEAKTRKSEARPIILTQIILTLKSRGEANYSARNHSA